MALDLVALNRKVESCSPSSPISKAPVGLLMFVMPKTIVTGFVIVFGVVVIEPKSFALKVRL